MVPAKTSSDHITVATKKGLKIDVFRHKAEESRKILSLPSAQTIMDVVPTILFVFLCVAFLVQKSAVCVDQGTKSVITRGLCIATASFSLTPLALALFVFTIVKQVKKAILQKQMKKRK